MLFYLYCIWTGERPYLVLIEPQLVDGGCLLSPDRMRLFEVSLSQTLGTCVRKHCANLVFYNFMLAKAFS